jgi:hypothetical protein
MHGIDSIVRHRPFDISRMQPLSLLLRIILMILITGFAVPWTNSECSGADGVLLPLGGLIVAGAGHWHQQTTRVSAIASSETVRRPAFVIRIVNKIASSRVLTASATKLTSCMQATNKTIGFNIDPAVAFSGKVIATVVNGLATFSSVFSGRAAVYPLQAASEGLLSVAPSPFSITPPRSTPTLTVPLPNACKSNYDQFYGSEPGVYAYWALCESGSSINAYDYVGKWDLSFTNAAGGFPAWGSGRIIGGLPGPVADGETAAQVTSAAYDIESQNIPLNRNQGTVATWINADSSDYPVTAVFFGAVHGKSLLSIGTSTHGSTCFNGRYTDLEGSSTVVQKCGYIANTWHRLVLTWCAGALRLYVDGALSAADKYSGALDNKVFYYRLFPGCCDTRKQMTLAKALVANQAWSGTQIAVDYAPVLIIPPAGGFYVTNTALGSIHRDILGYADCDADLSSPSLVSALTAGLKAAGVTSLRYANGSGGITADLENWQGGASCTHTPGTTSAAQNATTRNNLDTYIPQIAQPLGLRIGYTVNYGTNPPFCNAGGDPRINGANLVQYANVTKRYAIRYWEIGNEQYSPSTETDFHSDPNTGASYVSNEPAFYDAMKAKDKSIFIGVPIGAAGYETQTTFDLPVMAGAKYDAIVYHNYPMIDPISDGSTVYPERVSSNVVRTRGTLLTLQTELLNNGKSPDAIWITEWDGNVSGGKWSKQSMGAVMPLFVVTQLAEYMQAGVRYATWWAQGETDVCSRYNYDGNAEGAYNWWECGSGFLTYTGPLVGRGEVSVGLTAGDLTPSARAFQVLSQSGFVTEGEHMLRTVSDLQNAPWLEGYAATHGSSRAIILINRDRDSAHIVPVMLANMTSGSSVQQWSYGREQYDPSASGDWSVSPAHTALGAWSGNFQATLPPWSVNVFVFGK